jgi:isoamylase
MISEIKSGTYAAPDGIFSGIYPGKAFPLEATYDGKGVNFSIYSEQAEEVEFCIFLKIWIVRRSF